MIDFPLSLPRLRGKFLRGCLIFLLTSLALYGQPSMSENEVKALFLLNFAKYVEWPRGPATDGTIIIGILGQDNFRDILKDKLAGKTIEGRPVIIRHVSSLVEAEDCSVLFIASSEEARLDQILGRMRLLPVLTVGESTSFLAKGGIVNFILRDGKIHLQINLKGARQVNLQISSKLLSVADTVNE